MDKKIALPCVIQCTGRDHESMDRNPSNKALLNPRINENMYKYKLLEELTVRCVSGLPNSIH